MTYKQARKIPQVMMLQIKFESCEIKYSYRAKKMQL